MLYPGADWIGPTVNETPNGMSNVVGVVLHIQEGTESGSESWFNNPTAQASSHLLNPKSGRMRQMVDFKDKAWAEVAGNSHWISIENEGYNTESLTASQLQNVADFMKWANANFSVPLRITDDVNVGGLGWHGMGGSAWGGHFDCPGEPIKSQRGEILRRAGGTVTSPVPVPLNPPVLVPWPGVYLTFDPTDTFNRYTQMFQQRMLDRNWKSIGSADGEFGPKTLAVVNAFQREKFPNDPSQWDGIVGNNTWTAAFRTDNVT